MRDRLIEMIRNFPCINTNEKYFLESIASDFADYLLANGVIIAPMPMTDWLKQELTEHVYERCMEEL